MEKLAEEKQPAKGKTKTFLIGKELKTKDLLTIPRRNGQADRQQNPTQNQNQTPDSLRQGASQAAGAAPTLRYGPAGDSAPPLRLKALVWPKGSLPALSGPKTQPPFPLVNSVPLRIGPEQSRARSGEANP